VHQRSPGRHPDVPVGPGAAGHPLLGLIGAPLLITTTIAAFFGVIAQLSAWSAIATIPVALWELSLGLWMTFKGFKPSPITTGMQTADTRPTGRVPALSGQSI
jgi:hypothetical protein